MPQQNLCIWHKSLRNPSKNIEKVKNIDFQNFRTDEYSSNFQKLKKCTTWKILSSAFFMSFLFSSSRKNWNDSKMYSYKKNRNVLHNKFKVVNNVKKLLEIIFILVRSIYCLKLIWYKKGNCVLYYHILWCEKFKTKRGHFWMDSLTAGYTRIPLKSVFSTQNPGGPPRKFPGSCCPPLLLFWFLFLDCWKSLFYPYYKQ